MHFSRRAYLQHSVAAIVASHAVAAMRPVRLFADNGEQKGFEAEFPSMGSKINLRWYSSESTQDRILDAAIEIADKWVQVLSDYDPNSQTSSVCSKADGGDWVPVSIELWSVIQQCDQWNAWSGGAFDAALGATTSIRRQRKLASPAQWSQAKRVSGWGLIELDAGRQSIRFRTPGVRLDFGAIGKGVVVDRIAEKFSALGIERYAINASGNMRMGLAPNTTTGWPVAIDVPTTAPNEPSIELLRMRFKEGGIATSGDRWQRFPDANSKGTGDRTSHIIEPATGMGLSGHRSATIFADNAADADAAATATCVRANRDLAGWLHTLSIHQPNLQAIVLTRDNDSDPMRMISTGREPKR